MKKVRTSSKQTKNLIFKELYSVTQRGSFRGKNGFQKLRISNFYGHIFYHDPLSPFKYDVWPYQNH